MSRREEDLHGAAFRQPQERGAFRSRSIHHGAHIVHALLKGGQLGARDAIGQTCAALVEEDQPSKRRQAP